MIKKILSSLFLLFLVMLAAFQIAFKFIVKAFIVACGIYLVIGITYYFSKGLREMIQGIQEERAEKKSKKEK